MKATKLNINGEELTIKEACKKYNENIWKIRGRIRTGWTAEQAFGFKKRRPDPEDINTNKYKDRNDKIKIMVARGCPMLKVGKYFGISKQRVWEIIYGK